MALRHLVALGLGLGLALPLAAASAVAKDSPSAPDLLSAGNGFFTVYVDETSVNGRGLYSVTTGPSHPAGDGKNVLFAGPTSFNTIRSFTTGRNYVQRDIGGGAVWLDPYTSGAVAPLGSTGFRTTYVLPGNQTAPDRLTIVSDVRVNGTTLTTSAVEVTTTVTNNGTAPVSIGRRYLWDYQIALDDGPTFAPGSPPGAELIAEAEYTPPTFAWYRVRDNDANLSPPTFAVRGTVSGPAGVTPPPTQPTRLQYACWSDAAATAFDYAVSGQIIGVNDPSCPGSDGGDAAVAYYFGHDAASGTTIAPGASATVSASILADATPTAVLLSTLAASRRPAGTLVIWRTSSETDLLGFNVYRRAGGARVKVNGSLIRAAFARAPGRSYSWLDRSARGRGAARYWLEQVSLDGSSALHGPVTAS